MSARMLKRTALAVVVAAGLTLGAGCGSTTDDPPARPDAPIGLLKSATDGLLVFIGNQCGDAQYPSRVTVTNYNLATQSETSPALWDVSTSHPDLLPSLVIGKPPNGYNVVSDHTKDQGIGTVLRVQVVANGAQAAVFDTSKIADGGLLDALGNVTTVDGFRSRWGCG